jgi:hypothetical protein
VSSAGARPRTRTQAHRKLLLALEQLPPPQRSPGKSQRSPRKKRTAPAIPPRRVLAALLVVLAVAGGLLAVVLDVDPFGL